VLSVVDKYLPRLNSDRYISTFAR